MVISGVAGDLFAHGLGGEPDDGLFGTDGFGGGWINGRDGVAAGGRGVPRAE